jgi:hypothetical protein
VNLHIATSAQEKVNNAILISGSGRSGTTIMGMLMHSFKGVEYAFEPPALVSLMPLMKQMDEATWKLLYETYLYEDFFIGAISGRGINTNAIDDSSIYKVKTIEEVDARLNYSMRKTEAQALAESRTILFKMPNIVSFLPKLLDYYPGTRILIMKREAVGTINSLIEKRWFADTNLNANMNWPYRIFQDSQIPYWVKDGDDEAWITMSEVDRCAYYYIRVNEDVEHIPGRVEVKYNEFLADPKGTAAKLADFFGLQFGAKTEEILASVAHIKKDRDMSIMGKISPPLAERVTYYSSQS